MISALIGNIVSLNDNTLIVSTGAVHYEVYVPLSVSQRLTENKKSNGEISLITYHYYQMTPSSATPVLIGFINELERDFFLEFIKVSGIGPRAAVRAFNKAIGEIAQAIDRGDTNYLKTLPGIGAQRAKEIVAKLQGKMGKFTLMRDKVVPVVSKDDAGDLKHEAMAILAQLQYTTTEAQNMIDKALLLDPMIKTSEELLNAIYKQRIKA